MYFSIFFPNKKCAINGLVLRILEIIREKDMTNTVNTKDYKNSKKGELYTAKLGKTACILLKTKK